MRKRWIQVSCAWTQEEGKSAPPGAIHAVGVCPPNMLGAESTRFARRGEDPFDLRGWRGLGAIGRSVSGKHRRVSADPSVAHGQSSAKYHSLHRV